jgi:hypothetical protein
VVVSLSLAGSDAHAQASGSTGEHGSIGGSSGKDGKVGRAPEPPKGYHLEQRFPRRVVLAGALLFGIPYALTSLVSAQALAKGGGTAWAWGFAPAVGPFVGVSYISTNSDFAIIAWGVDAFLVADGLCQTIGLGLLVYGLTHPNKVLVPNEAGRLRWLPRALRLSAHEALFGLSEVF